MRRTFPASVAACALVALVAACGVRPTASAPPTTPPATPPPATTAVPVIFGTVVQFPDGKRVTIPLPEGEVARNATRLPGAWLVLTTSGILWYVRDGQKARYVGGSAESATVSADGRRLAVPGAGQGFGGSGSDDAGPTTVVAYELPALRELRRVEVADVMTLRAPEPIARVAGISGDLVLIRVLENRQVRYPSPVLVWNMRTGAAKPVVHKGLWLWHVAAGMALRRVDRPHPTTESATSACVDAVRITTTLPVGDTGYCGERATDIGGGALSPDGTWAVLDVAGRTGQDPSANGPLLVRTSDLRAGTLRPSPLGWPAGKPLAILFWDGPGSFLVNAIDGYYSCTVDGAGCRRVSTPADAVTPAPDAVPVGGLGR